MTNDTGQRKPLLLGIAPERYPRAGEHLEPLSGATGRRVASWCGFPDTLEITRYFDAATLLMHPTANLDFVDRRKAALTMAALIPIYFPGRDVVLLDNAVSMAFNDAITGQQRPVHFLATPLEWYGVRWLDNVDECRVARATPGSDRQARAFFCDMIGSDR